MSLALLLLLLCIECAASSPSDAIAEFVVVAVDVLVNAASLDSSRLSTLCALIFCGGDGGDEKKLLIGRYISMILFLSNTERRRKHILLLGVFPFLLRLGLISICLPFVWVLCVDFVDHGLKTAWNVSQISTFGQVFIGERFDGSQSEMSHFIDLRFTWQIWWHQ